MKRKFIVKASTESKRGKVYANMLDKELLADDHTLQMVSTAMYNVMEERQVLWETATQFPENSVSSKFIYFYMIESPTMSQNLKDEYIKQLELLDVPDPNMWFDWIVNLRYEDFCYMMNIQ